MDFHQDVFRIAAKHPQIHMPSDLVHTSGIAAEPRCAFIGLAREGNRWSMQWLVDWLVGLKSTEVPAHPVHLFFCFKDIWWRLKVFLVGSGPL